MKAQKLIEMLSKNPDLEIGVVDIGYFFTPGILPAEKHKIISAFVKMFGKFKMKSYAQMNVKDLDLLHESENLRVRLNAVAQCRIVGKRIIKQKRLVPAQAVDMVEIEETRMVSVSDCDIKNGSVNPSDVVFDEFAVDPNQLENEQPKLEMQEAF